MATMLSTTPKPKPIALTHQGSLRDKLGAKKATNATPKLRMPNASPTRFPKSTSLLYFRPRSPDPGKSFEDEVTARRMHPNLDLVVTIRLNGRKGWEAGKPEDLFEVRHH